MINITRIPETSALRLPITSQAAKTAEQFALQQRLHKREQVYWNTLAVCAVNDYLQMIGFQTDLTTGDSWNAIARSVTDTADLEIVGVGRLECRPILLNEQTCSIPPEVLSDRIGYVIARIHPEERAVTILGFTPESAEMVSLHHLQSPIELVNHLHRLLAPAEPALVRLNQWIQGIVEAGWEPIDALLNPSQLTFRTRSEAGVIDRAKLIDFGIQFAETQVALLVELALQPRDSINPTAPVRTQIRLQVHPTQQPYLPPNLQLLVLDETGMTFLETQSRSSDNVIQLQFFGNPGERFTVNIALGHASVIEQFVI